MNKAAEAIMVFEIIISLKKGNIMFYKTLETKDLLNKNEGSKQIIDLLDNENSHLKLVYMEKEESFDSLIQPVNVCIYMIDGEITLFFYEKPVCSKYFCSSYTQKNKKEYKIKKNQLFMFEKNIPHSASALKDSLFLLAKI